MPSPNANQETLRVVTLHNARWAAGDVAGVLALYHPAMRFVEHFSGRCYEGEVLREHVRSVLERSALDTLEYLDRPRIDHDMAFLRYREVMRSVDGSELLSFSACDAVRVSQGLIVEIDEYALLQPTTAKTSRSASAQKIGLGPRALGRLLADLSQYFERDRPFLDANLSLQTVADACGYTRNQISYALNHGMGLTFYQYLNRARIRHVLASDPTLGVLERARVAGFRSVSTFYAAYRAETGQTPGARRKKDAMISDPDI